MPDQVVRVVAVDKLRLDTSNFRFGENTVDNEPMAFNFLFDEYDGLDLARKLLREGYATNELPLVAEEDDAYVVLEANRRVSTLRALQNPALAPKFENQLKQLIKRHQSEADALPAEVHVMVSKSREAAAPILARLHIGQDKKKWGLDEQARFVRAQLTNGTDIATLKDTLTGIENIPRLVKMNNVREALHNVKFTKQELKKFALSNKLKMSTFEYVYTSRDVRPLLGFEFDKDGEVTSYPTSTGEIRRLEHVLRGIKDGDLSTRKVLNKKRGTEFRELVEYLEQMPHSAPGQMEEVPPSEIGSTGMLFRGDVEKIDRGQSNAPEADRPHDHSQSGGAPSATLGEIKVRGKNNPELSATLNLEGLLHLSVPESTTARLGELRSIKLSSHPAAAIMLLRATVEAAIKEHFAQRGETASGQLGSAAKALRAKYSNRKDLKRPIGLINGELGPGPGSLDWLNGPAHSMHVSTSIEEIHKAYRELHPLLQFLLPSPTTPHLTV